MMYCELCEHWSVNCASPRTLIGAIAVDGKEEFFSAKVRICDECVTDFEEDEED